MSKVRATGVRDLKNYLDFAIRGPRALVEQVLPTGREPDSPFEREVIAILRNKGWDVHPQVGVSGYRVDIGIVDPRAPGRYLLGVECDGRTYHSGATARDRDRLRQYVLEGLGWELFRIWSTDWWLNPQEPIRKLEARLHQLMQKVGQPETVVLVAPVAPDAAPTTQAAADVSTSAPLQLYRAAELSEVEDGDVYAAASVETLRSQLLQVINEEGPIADHIAFKRVTRAWGLAKTGRRIQDLLESLLPHNVATTGDSPKFYWPQEVQPASWTGFRVPGADSESKRSLDELSHEEIVNVAHFLLSQHGNMPVDALARSICRLLGIARTTADAERRVASALTHHTALDRIAVHNGIVQTAGQLG